MRQHSRLNGIRYALRARGRALQAWWYGCLATLEELLTASSVRKSPQHGHFTNRTRRERAELHVSQARPRVMVRAYLAEERRISNTESRQRADWVAE